MEKNDFKIVIVGAGPGGLMAAQVLAGAGCSVAVYDRMPTPGRKFLMAGRGGLNMTHSEALESFISRYGASADWIGPCVRAFPPDALREWCEKLGHKTVVGSSGRVFPEEFKSSPLLRSWLKKLGELGVTFHFRQTWAGWNDSGEMIFQDADGKTDFVKADAALLALGGASWPRLGSDGNWVSVLLHEKIPVAPLRPANCGFEVKWSERLVQRYTGQPVKSMRATFGDKSVRGEAMVTEKGIEGGAIYALSSALRDEIEKNGKAILHLDLRPDLSLERLTEKLELPQKGQSRSTFLRKAAGMSPIAISLTQEILHKDPRPAESPASLAALIKALPLTLTAPFSLERAISSAGGICREALDGNFMLIEKPGVFAAGEMLDWEAPTGGYLLQGTFSTAFAAAQGMLLWLKGR
ncbi:MAG: TIGR03862 family flavoprotein [Alphaproteobacteria bacterium]|nr:TIGR03862 family flavoprotein [Alphaproteobacteria bacterium]